MLHEKPQADILLEMDLTVSPTTFPCVCHFPMQRMNYLSNLTLHLQFTHCSLERDLMHLKQVNLPSHLFTSTCTSVTSTYTSVLNVQLNFNICIAIAIVISTACFILLYFAVTSNYLTLTLDSRFSALSQLLHFRQKKKCPHHLHEYCAKDLHYCCPQPMQSVLGNTKEYQKKNTEKKTSE